jgi:hypothetical protein
MRNKPVRTHSIRRLHIGSLFLCALLIITIAIRSQAAETPKQVPGTQSESLPKENPKKDSTPKSAATESWQSLVEPFMWLPTSVAVRVTAKSFNVSTNFNASDILRAVQFAGFLHGEVWKGRLGLFADLMYLNFMETRRASSFSLFAPSDLNLEGGFQAAAVEAGGFYRFGKEPVTFDVLAGIRYINIEAHAEAGLLVANGDASFIEPLIGGNLRFRLSRRWDLSVSGDAGGFGLGSELTYDSRATIRYRFSKLADLGVGYRYVGVEYKKYGFTFDSQIAGPVVGFAFHW